MNELQNKEDNTIESTGIIRKELHLSIINHEKIYKMQK